MAAMAAINWWSRSQKIITLSTCEVELQALIEMCLEVVSLKPLLIKLGVIKSGRDLVILQDNQSTIAVASRFELSRRTKHFDLKHCWITEAIERKEFVLHYCATDRMIADGMRKLLDRVLFERSRNQYGMVVVPDWVLLLRKTALATLKEKLANSQ